MDAEAGKEKGRATSPPRSLEEVAPLDGVVVPVVRCPFCRDAIVATDRAKLACNACMAWHHTACWTEHGRCAGCGGAESGPAGVAVAPAARSTDVGSGATGALRPAVPEAVNPVVAGWLVFVLGAACTLLTLLLAARGLTANARPSDALFLLPAAISALLAHTGYAHARGRR